MANRLIEGADSLARIAELEELNEQHRVENGKLREVIRAQGEFIIGIKHSIRDFVGNA